MLWFSMVCLCLESEEHSIHRSRRNEVGLMMEYLHNAGRSMERIIIKPETALVRPFVVCAVLRGVSFDKHRYTSFIDLQVKGWKNWSAVHLIIKYCWCIPEVSQAELADLVFSDLFAQLYRHRISNASSLILRLHCNCQLWWLILLGFTGTEVLTMPFFHQYSPLIGQTTLDCFLSFHCTFLLSSDCTCKEAETFRSQDGAIHKISLTVLSIHPLESTLSI